MKEDLSGDDKQKLAYSLVSLAKTLDQAKCVQSFTQILADQKRALRTTVSLTAGRGRGKSAALGLALSAAVTSG
jgi:N-acetyltransferase 10